MGQPRWDVFYDFHKWLFEAYPGVFKHESVNVTIVNKLAILTTVNGSDPTLKPLLLMSHFDVVPAPKETYSRWTYPPFSGTIDEERKFVYGRGASDCKDLMTAQYEALTLLLESGFQPKRTIILAHGNDEETTGQNGARKLAPYIESLYGKDSILMVVDEGDSSERLFGTAFALPGTAEKGYLDVEVSVGVKGGHSSVPPRHTGIGIAAEAIQAIEAHSMDRDFMSAFRTEDDPVLQFLVCAAEHAKDFPKSWSRLVKKRNWASLAKKFSEYKPEMKGKPDVRVPCGREA
jgi:Gly-Xaa carboxypeptidase